MSERRMFSIETKISIVREAFSPGGNVKATASKHDLGCNTLYRWKSELKTHGLAQVRELHSQACIVSNRRTPEIEELMSEYLKLKKRLEEIRVELKELI